MPTFLTLGMPAPEGHRPLLDRLLVAGPAGPVALRADLDADAAADTLAVLVHREGAFTASAADGAGVLRVLAATVAALRGDDVRAAWTSPDATRVAAVPDRAAEALREVLAQVLVPDVERVADELARLGL